MPACQMWESCPLYLVRRQHAGMRDVGVMPSLSRPAPACRHAGHGSHALCNSSGDGMPACRLRESCLCISSSAGMPACRTWESCPLYLVRRRHAGMPEVGVVPSVSRPAPACRHPGCESWLLKLFLLNLVRCRHAGMPDVRLCLLILCRRRHAGMPDIKLCLLYLDRRRHAGMPDVKLCL